MRTHDAAFAALLADWLANVFVADDLAPRWLRVTSCLPEDSLWSRPRTKCRATTCIFMRRTMQAAGLLARRLEIENLEREVRAQRLIVDEVDRSSCAQ